MSKKKNLEDVGVVLGSTEATQASNIAEVTGEAGASPLPASQLPTALPTFNGKLWQTPDGRQFNTRLKAMKAMKLINNNKQ
jgi:hypothetical protein